jgi:putative ABC transport system ATP-binding protein
MHDTKPKNSEPAVICKGIKKHFGEGPTRVDALRGIDLEVQRGELLMLMGPSGSGKTTLISIISGILTQSEGECLVSNLNLNQMPDEEKVHYRGKYIGFVFQLFNLIPTLTCRENVSIPLILNRVDKKTALKRSEELLSRLGIPDKVHNLPTELSGGQQQRVAIARSIIHDPELVVCDEPTSFLDHDTGKMIMELLRDIVKQKGATLIVVTHDVRIVPFADRIVNIEDGRVAERNQKTIESKD